MAWKLRHKIAVGTARGLHYLHKGCQRRIIHRDINASNILLTTNFEPQVLLPTPDTAEQVSYIEQSIMKQGNCLTKIKHMDVRFQILGWQDGSLRSGLIGPLRL